jgi:hypothetical protein
MKTSELASVNVFMSMNEAFRCSVVEDQNSSRCWQPPMIEGPVLYISLIHEGALHMRQENAGID